MTEVRFQNTDTTNLFDASLKLLIEAGNLPIL